MAEIKYDPELQGLLDDLLLEMPDITAAMIFGLPCYKIDNKVFATLFGEGVGIKIPAERAQELLIELNIVPFEPFGRNRGSEHVQINHNNLNDYRQDKELFRESIAYVASLPAPKKRKKK